MEILQILEHHVGFPVHLIADDVRPFIQCDDQTAKLVAHFQAATIDAVIDLFELYAHCISSFLILLSISSAEAEEGSVLREKAGMEILVFGKHLSGNRECQAEQIACQSLPSGKFRVFLLNLCKGME